MTRPAHPHTDAAAIETIHAGTAIYTAQPEIEKLLDRIGWPECGGRLLDPGCGDGNMVIAALTRLDLCPKPGCAREAFRVQGIEFHKDSVHETRRRYRTLLIERGWDSWEAMSTANMAIKERDYLLDPHDGQWDIILSNPPYWRRNRLPEEYRGKFDETVAKHARGDLMHAYLDQMLRNLKDGGRLALVTSDRWLTNSGAAALREKIGERLAVSYVERLDSASAFHRTKDRVKDSPPRVHAVGLVLEPEGRRLSRDPFIIEDLPEVDGVPLTDLVDIRLAPWLGPDGIFIVDRPDAVPGARTVPCVLPKGIDPETGRVTPPTRWAIVTGDDMPVPAVMTHLDSQLHRMPQRGRRKTRWLPPERFDHLLPLGRDAILVPRIAKRMKAITLPRGHLPTNHSLVVISGGMDSDQIRVMLEHPVVQAQADALAARVEDGYRSYTTTLLRQIIIPHEAIPTTVREAA